MIATAISYFVTGLLFLLGIYGSYWTAFKTADADPDTVLASFVASLVVFAMSYGCARLAGI